MRNYCKQTSQNFVFRISHSNRHASQNWMQQKSDYYLCYFSNNRFVFTISNFLTFQTGCKTWIHRVRHQVLFGIGCHLWFCSFENEFAKLMNPIVKHCNKKCWCQHAKFSWKSDYGTAEVRWDLWSTLMTQMIHSPGNPDLAPRWKPQIDFGSLE